MNYSDQKSDVNTAKERQRRKSAVPLQRTRSAEADCQRRDLGVQPQLHAVHPAVDLRPADVDVVAVHLRLWLFQRRHDRGGVPAVRRPAPEGVRAADGPVEEQSAVADDAGAQFQAVHSAGRLRHQSNTAHEFRVAGRFVYRLSHNSHQSMIKNKIYYLFVIY